PVHPDRPAERLPVDDVDEDERHRPAREEAQESAEPSDRDGLPPHGGRDALRRRAENPEEADLPPPLEDERHERVEDAEDRDRDRDRLERVRHRERAVEDAEDLAPENRVRADAEREAAAHR